jgi:GDPmannose 4,6-dehydratase
LGKALVLGINGQDGSYLGELLLERGVEVVGWIPSSIPVSLEDIQHIIKRIQIVEGSLSDQEAINACIEEHRPDEIYNLASPSSPVASWDSTVEVGDMPGLGVARLLEAIRVIRPAAHFYQASSSELFGNPVDVPQNETTPFRPRNPYGIAKLYAHWLTVRYRQKYGLFAVSGILFNHESPRRGVQFVTRKITHTAAKIKLGLESELRLGNLDARRDWGFARDYTEAMWLMMHQEAAGDFVIGTAETHSVREFCELAFGFLDLDYRDYVVQDPQFYRHLETRQLVADYSKAFKKLGWHPNLKFEELVKLMVDADLTTLQSNS